MDWMYLAQGRAQRPVLVITVVNIGVQEKTGNFLPSGRPASLLSGVMWGCWNCHANCGACGLGSLCHCDCQVG